tara:strand:+ start:14517 stop:14654 length:138 start_codon:yes stop_codon:yes gene_type:complete
MAADSKLLILHPSVETAASPGVPGELNLRAVRAPETGAADVGDDT